MNKSSIEIFVKKNVSLAYVEGKYYLCIKSAKERTMDSEKTTSLEAIPLNVELGLMIPNELQRPKPDMITKEFLSPAHRSLLEKQATISKLNRWITFQTLVINPDATISANSSINKESISEGDMLDMMARLLYDTVLEALGGDNFKLDNAFNHSDEEKTFVIQSLRTKGFDVGEDDYEDIIAVAAIIRDQKFSNISHRMSANKQFRHASLNSHDFEILKTEMNRLAEKYTGISKLSIYAPKLMSIYHSSINTDNNLYPGRHLPFNRVTGRTSTRYKCLRILDEILCTIETGLTNQEIRKEIIAKAKEHKIYSPTKKIGFISEEDLTDEALKKLYFILSQLITANHFRDNQIGYKREVYDTNRTGQRKYLQSDEHSRVCAFCVDISLAEVPYLRRDVGMLRAKYFADDNDLFASEFPLISTLGRMEESREAYEDEDLSMVSKVKESDLYLLNYNSPSNQDARKKMESAVSLGLPISLYLEDKWESLYPISLQEDGDKWGLMAESIHTHDIHMISSNVIASSLRRVSQRKDFKSISSHPIIGTGAILHPKPFNVEVIMTEKGASEFIKMKSIQALNPEVTTIRDKYYSREGNEKTQIRITAYINDDLLEILLDFDAKGKLIEINPPELMDIYIPFFKKKMNREAYQPYDERPSCKRIRKKKKME